MRTDHVAEVLRLVREQRPVRRSDARPLSDVEEMRELWLDGTTQAEIGRRFGITTSCVSAYIRFGVARPTKEQRARGWVWNGRPARVRRDPLDVEAMRLMRAGGHSYTAIGKHFGLSAGTVTNYVRHGVASPKKRSRHAA